MFIWRMSKHDDLSGRGGLIASGRWHTKPNSIVYCAEKPSSAYAEILGQIGDVSLMPEAYQLLKIHVPDFITIETVDATSLSEQWHHRDGWKICRPIGDEWLVSQRTTLLKVPSAVQRGEINYLGNPAANHWPDLKIADIISQPFPAWVLGP